MTSISKSLSSVLKWTGKYSFLTFVLSLILTGVLISLAAPHATTYYVGENEVESHFFTLQSAEEYQIFFSSHEADDLEISLFQLSFVNGNETFNFRQSTDDIVQIEEIFSVTTDVFYRVLDLASGEYRLDIINNNSRSMEATIATANFNLGQIVAAAISWVIFSILLSIFFTILPFWIISLFVDSAIGQKSSTSDIPPRQAQQSYSDQQVYNQSKPSENVIKTSPHSRGKVAQRSNVPDFIKGTQFEKLIRKDWIMLAIGGFFFIGYLSNPFEGFLLFLTAAVWIAVAYNVTEREKSKQRIDILMRSYPKVSIGFIAEQLDKEEDYITDILRIMILDEGYPIRLDLINRSVLKIGPFSGEQSSSVSTPTNDTEVASSINSDSDDESNDGIQSSPQSDIDTQDLENQREQSQVRHGERGTVTEPWAYCQSCGEGLKQKIKYCYICGARQYE